MVFATRAIKQWLIDPTIIFVLSQLVFFMGSLPFLDNKIPADAINCMIMVVSIGFFIIGASIVDMANPVPRKNVRLWLRSPLQTIESSTSFNYLLGIIIAVSIIVSMAYFHAVGYNIFLGSIVSLIKGDDISALAAGMVTKRLESYSGETYFAPGYVNQFKNILLPLITIYLIARYSLQKNVNDFIIVLGLVPLSIVFLFGTGQRGAFIHIVLILIVFINIAMTGKRLLLTNITVLMITVILFAFISFSLGRVTNDKATGHTLITNLVLELPNRISTGNQLAGVIGFRYIYDKQFQHGADLWSHMKEILPGQGSKLTIESEISQILSGSTRGTAPLSIWGQIWYDFGPIGVVLTSFIMGLLYKGVYIKFLSQQKTMFNLLIHAGITVIIGTWVAGAPNILINSGLVTVIFFKVIVHYWEKLHSLIFKLTRMESYDL